MMNEIKAEDVITDGSNTQIICDDLQYHKQLNGSMQRNLNKVLTKFADLDIRQKEKYVTTVRAIVKEMGDEFRFTGRP